jgi:hypothetical protein
VRRRLITLMFLAAVLPPDRVLGADGSRGLTDGQILRGRFVQERHLTGFDAPLTSAGDFTLIMGRGLIWRAETPFVITTVITANGLAQLIPGAAPMRLPASRIPFLARLHGMLSGALAGDWRLVEPDFTVTRAGATGQTRVTLIPRRPDAVAMPFQTIEITVGRYVERVTMTRPDGDREILTFHDQAVSAGPPRGGEDAALAAAGQ